MNRRTFLSASVIAVVMMNALVVTAKDNQSLELFGVPIKGALRDSLRQAFKQNGMQAIREDKDFWVDTYNPQNVLDGASEFKAGYVSATDQFAFAQYTFSGFMDTELVGKVISRVAAKYGRPSSLNGRFSLGPVVAQWNLPQGMRIEVSRGWPDTTTLLKYFDTAAYRQMSSEIDVENSKQERQKVKSQSKAF